jgi:TPR repeat protein
MITGTMLADEQDESAEALFMNAERLEEQGEFRQAFECLLSAAKGGHVSSQINVGNYYANGTGVKKDERKAAFWYRRAYRSGDSTGAFNLAIDLRNQGRIRAAVIWFKKAIELEDGEAHTELAKIYINRPHGKKAAIELLEKAISFRLGCMSESGKEEAQELLNRLIKC